MDKTFGDRIRELRDAKDLSLREFGRLLNKSAPFLSDIELGRRYPSPELLVEMAAVLKTTVDDLKKYDTRAPLEELKRLANDNPAYGLALRKLIDKQFSAEELNRLADHKRKPTKD